MTCGLPVDSAICLVPTRNIISASRKRQDAWQAIQLLQLTLANHVPARESSYPLPTAASIMSSSSSASRSNPARSGNVVKHSLRLMPTTQLNSRS